MAARSRSRTLDTACSSHLPTRFNSYGPSLLHGPAMHGVAERQRWNFVLPQEVDVGKLRGGTLWARRSEFFSTATLPIAR